MPDIFQFPEIRRDRDSIRLFRTPFPKHSLDAVTKLAKRLGTTGVPRDAGARLIVTDRRSALEVFTASDSVRGVLSTRPNRRRRARSLFQKRKKQ